MSSPLPLPLPAGPGASTAARSGGPGRAADRGTPEAFGSALKDALAGTGTPSRPATGRAEGQPDDIAADAPAGAAPEERPADTEAPPVADLPPGIWALLSGAIGPATASPASTAAAGTPAGIVPLEAVGTAPALPPAADLPGAAVPGDVAAAAVPPPTARSAPAAPTPIGAHPSVTDQERGASAEALARAAGLTVVPAPAGGDGPVPAAVPAPAAADVPVPAPTSGDADVSAVVGDPAPLTPLATGTAGGSTDRSGPGSGDGPGFPGPATATTADPEPAGDVTTGVPGAAVPTPAVPTTPAAAGPAAGREAPVAAQLAPQLAVLRSAPDGSQSMTLVLTPDSLGEVTVQVTITDGTLDVMLRGGSEHGRHALADALPELRRDLESAGLSFSRLAVDPDAPGDGGPGNRTTEQLLADMRGNGGQQQRNDSSRSRTWAPSGAPLGEAGPAPTAHSSASTGVDVRV